MKPKTYHFIGIKGSGMSGLATLLHDLGHQVQGSDIEDFLFTQVGLETRQIPLFPFNQAPIQPNMTVVIGNAFKTHPEIERAHSVGAQCVSYHECLAQVLTTYTSIAVTGTHGKTTTTGLLASVLGMVHPTSYLIGDGTGKGSPQATHFAFEACEYQRHFLAYRPDYTLITNIEFDHPDYFKDIEDVIAAFQSLAHQTKQRIIACGDDLNVGKLQPKTSLITYGLASSNHVQAINIQKTEEGTAFDVFIDGAFYHHFQTPFFGDHMILNSLAVITVAQFESIPASFIEQGLQHFKGVQRRFSETLVNKQIVIDDYAHHPTEIQATLSAVRQKYPNRPCVAIFQPHTFSRTQAFLTEFADSLSLADQIYLTDIFGSAREIQGDTQIQDLIERCVHAKHLTLTNIECLTHYPNAILVFMGAGDIKKYEEAYLRAVNK